MSTRGLRSLVGVAVGVLVAGLLVALAPGAGAQTTFAPSSTTTDGDTDSLRDVLETQVADGDIVVLDGGTYVLDAAGGDIVIAAGVTIQGNGSTIQQTVAGERVLFTGFDLTLDTVTITGGSSGGDGGGLRSTNPEAVLNINRTTFADNAAAGDGGAFETDARATIIASTFNGNCSEDSGGAVDLDGGGNHTIVNSTFTDNTSLEDGAIDLDDETVTIVYSTIVANIHADEVDCGVEAEALPDAEPAADADDEVEAAQAGNPANISISEDDEGETLSIFGTVVALPLGGPNCADDTNDDDPLNETISAGFNFSDDATCGLTNAASGDRENAGDPLLAALASNGGPTQTLLPQTASPLVNFIPISSCGGGDGLAGFAVVDDQRGVTRPQETGCEIGSVELPAAAVVVTPTFTG